MLQLKMKKLKNNSFKNTTVQYFLHQEQNFISFLKYIFINTYQLPQLDRDMPI